MPTFKFAMRTFKKKFPYNIWLLPWQQLWLVLILLLSQVPCYINISYIVLFMQKFSKYIVLRNWCTFYTENDWIEKS